MDAYTKKVELVESYERTGDGGFRWTGIHGEIVRCEACVHWIVDEEEKRHGYCGALDQATVSRFFCADGRRGQRPE